LHALALQPLVLKETRVFDGYGDVPGQGF